MQESSLRWAGTLALVTLAVLVLAFVWPEIDGWHGDWRDYAHETRYGGVCSAPDAATRPANCDTAPPVELWMFVPWMMAIGSTAAMLIICWPQTVPLRRQDPDG